MRVCLVFTLVDGQRFRRGIPSLAAEAGKVHAPALGLANYYRPPTHTHLFFSFGGSKVGWQHVLGIHSPGKWVRKGVDGADTEKYGIKHVHKTEIFSFSGNIKVPSHKIKGKTWHFNRKMNDVLRLQIQWCVSQP